MRSPPRCWIHEEGATGAIRVRANSDCPCGRDAAATRRPADAMGCIGKSAPVGDREPDDPGLRNRVEARAGESRAKVENSVPHAAPAFPETKRPDLSRPSLLARSCLRPEAAAIRRQCDAAADGTFAFAQIQACGSGSARVLSFSAPLGRAIAMATIHHSGSRPVGVRPTIASAPRASVPVADSRAHGKAYGDAGYLCSAAGVHQLTRRPWGARIWAKARAERFARGRRCTKHAHPGVCADAP